MKCKTLINFIGKYNHYNILAALNLEPETIVFVRSEEDSEAYDNTIHCIAQRLHGIKFVDCIIQQQSYLEISQIISKYSSEDTCVNLSGSNKLIGLLAMHAAAAGKAVPIYIDNDKGSILKFTDTVEELMPLDIELTVQDIICSTGAEILKHSTDMFEKKEFKALVGFITENYRSWIMVKEILRNSHLVNQFPMQPLLIEISIGKLSNEQIRALEEFLREISYYKLIVHYKFYIDYIEFTFANREAKAFVMTAGCWLEALTYSCIKELVEVSSVVSSMLFVWDEEIQVHNELDVVAAVDSHLVCISCKDTEKYDVEELNELEVYAEHLGGRKVKKILVSTEQPERGEMTYQRAEEMGISIVLFNGEVNRFKNELHAILI